MRHWHIGGLFVKTLRDELLRHRLNPRDLSLHYLGHIDNLVGVLNLRDLGILGHLVGRRSVRAYAPRCALGKCPSPRPRESLP